MSNTFLLKIRTPECEFGSFDVTSFTCNGLDGEVCILKDHMPMMLAIDSGILKYTVDGEEKKAVCDSGFCEVNNNEVTVFTDHCFPAEEVADINALIAAHKKKAEEVVREHRRHEIKLIRMAENIQKM